MTTSVPPARESGTRMLQRNRPITAQQLRDRADWIRLRVLEMIDSVGLATGVGVGTPAAILAHYGITDDGVSARALELLGTG